MIPAVYNTKEKGVLHFVFYKDGDDYVGVCLNFDIVEYGKDLKELQKSVQEAAQSYLLAVNKKKASDDCLNICTDKKHLKVLSEIKNFMELKERSKKRSLPSKLTPFSVTFKSYNKQQFL
jgi:hypothetical protein